MPESPARLLREQLQIIAIAIVFLVGSPAGRIGVIVCSGDLRRDVKQVAPVLGTTCRWLLNLSNLHHRGLQRRCWIPTVAVADRFLTGVEDGVVVQLILVLPEWERR
jgi:hypothetical protein